MPSKYEGLPAFMLVAGLVGVAVTAWSDCAVLDPRPDSRVIPVEWDMVQGMGSGGTQSIL